MNHGKPINMYNLVYYQTPASAATTPPPLEQHFTFIAEFKTDNIEKIYNQIKSIYCTLTSNVSNISHVIYMSL